MQNTQKVQLSVKEHIKAVLTTAGWSNTDKWVRLGRIQPETRPPAVAVDCSEMQYSGREVGNGKLAVKAFCSVEVKANDESQLESIKDSIEANLDNMRIIDFNVAMPSDPGYDAETQTIARGLVGETIQGRVSDPSNLKATISFLLEASKPV